MRLPFLAAGSAQPLPITPRPRIVARQSQASAATAQVGVTRIVAQQSQSSTAKARPKIAARQSQATAARARTRIAAQQSQRSTATAAANLWPNGYRYQHEIRLRAWPGGGPSIANFLLPFSEQLDAFKLVANGGEVEHSSGYDIRFETTGGTKLGHILLSYSGTTGRLAALVNMPRDFAAAQSIYVYVGKSGMVASEESAANARAGGWLVWFKGGSVTDLTGQSRNLTASGTPGSTTLLGLPAYDFDGLDDYGGSLAATGFANGLTAISCVTLAQADALNQLRGLFNITNATEMELGLRYKATAGRLVAAAKFGTSSYLYESADNAQSTDAQAVAFVAEAGAAMRMAINGSLDTPSAGSGTLSSTLSISDNLEWGRGGIGTIGFWNGPAAFLGLRSGSMSNAELESVTAALSDPRLVYGVGSANLVSSSARAPVALPVFASVTAGVPADINVGAAGYDQNGDTLSVTDAAVVSGAATITTPSGGLVRLTGNAGVAQSIIGEGGLRDPAGGRSRWRLYATAAAPSLLYPEAPFTPTSVITATDAADFASKYNTTLAAGQHLKLPSGTVALSDGFAFNRTFAAPGVAIVGAGMAANGRDPLTVIPSKELTVTKDRHAFHQLQFTHSLSGSNSKLTDADPYIMRITAAYFSMTKCWMRGNRGIFFADSTACHDNYVGWNRMSTAVAQGLQFVKWSLEPLPTGSVKHRNSILANNYIRATGPSDDNNAYTIYIGNGHARGGDDRYIQGFKVVNNLWDSPAAGWDKALYFKCGVEEISGNTILNGTQSFIMRHGSIVDGADKTTTTISCQKLWNNYFDVSFFILGGAGHDVRGNYIKVNDGLRIDCGWTQSSGGQYHDAASHSLFVRNQIITGTDATRPYRLGYYDAGGTAPTDRRGGKLRDVKIWGHLGNALVPGISSLIHDAATVDAASLSFSTSLGSYADPGIATALAQTQVGFKVTGQNNG